MGWENGLFCGGGRVKQESKVKKYCLGRNCIHRRGCGKYLNRHLVKFEYELVNEQDCFESEPMPYEWLDRVKLSTGDPLPKSKRGE